MSSSEEAKLERPIYKLLQESPFYAHFLLGSRVLYDVKGVERAAVRIIDGDIQFLINTEWYFNRSLTEQVAVIKHEVFHVLLEHCGSRSSRLNRRNHQAINVAMDCAINQHISGLPEGCVTLRSLEEFCKKSLNKADIWEYYYAQMYQAAEEQGKMVPGEGDPHDHDFMEGDGDPENEAKGQMRRAAVKDAASKAMAASAGNVPSELQSTLGRLNQAAKLPWKQQLRNFVASARDIRTKNTRLRTNRRFDLDQPGKKKIRELVLGVCTDSSGSVSDESYMMFMNEVAVIAKSTKITYLIQADCVVQKVDVIKGGKPKKGVLETRAGSGGTAYQPALDKCKELGVDAIILFGDGDAADVPKNPGVPFIWVLVGNQEPPASFGRVLRL